MTRKAPGSAAGSSSAGSPAGSTGGSNTGSKAGSSDAASHVAAHRARRAASRHQTLRTQDTNAAGRPHAASAEHSPERVAAWVITLLLIATPLIVLSNAKEAFRLPQGLASGWLGLASLLAISWRLQTGVRTTVAEVWRQPAVRAVVPLLLIVAAGGFFTAHPAHFRASFADFAIGAACVIGWSLALSGATLGRLLTWTIPPAVLVAALGLDQVTGLFGTLDWLALAQTSDRLRLTSTVGNPGDLAALLVLPILVSLTRWRDASSRGRWLLGAGLIVMLVTLAMTATFAATGATLVGAGVWFVLARGVGRASAAPLHASGSPARSSMMWRPIAAVLALLVIASAAMLVVTPLRERAARKATQLASGDINGLLTGRLDGWRVAIAMLRAHPAGGVTQGAYRAEFADTRLALTDRGVPFYREQVQVILATPHNEALSVAAEQGLPGLVALAWALWCLAMAARRLGTEHARDRDAHALAWAGLAALGVLATFSFPLHVASVAWPWLLFLAWLCRSAAERLPAPDAAHAAPNRFAIPVSGRQLFPILFVGAIAAIWWQSTRASDRIAASRLLAQVESRTMAAIQLKRAPSTLFTQHLDWLATAERLDPLEIGVPMARGTQFLLLRRPDEAIAAYRQAAALEPRPEIDLNIGRALWMRGDQEEARAAFARAVKLSPILREEVPAGLLGPQ